MIREARPRPHRGKRRLASVTVPPLALYLIARGRWGVWLSSKARAAFRVVTPLHDRERRGTTPPGEDGATAGGGLGVRSCPEGGRRCVRMRGGRVGAAPGALVTGGEN
jgi:hypothetical protein